MSRPGLTCQKVRHRSSGPAAAAARDGSHEDQWPITQSEMQHALDFMTTVPPEDKGTREETEPNLTQDALTAAVEERAAAKPTAEHKEPGIKPTKHMVRDIYAREIPYLSEPVRKTIEELVRLSQHGFNDHDEAMRVYMSLPHPRVLYMQDWMLIDLLHMIRKVQRKTEKHVDQYFMVMKDMAASGITPSTRDFASAIAFVGKMRGTTRAQALSRALSIMRQMESRGDRRPDRIAFHTVAHLCLRAERYTSFETVLDEMAKSGIRPDRYTFLLRLSFHGSRRDISGVKAVYKEMIAAGIFVDTIVLHIVLKAFLVTGDPEMAEKVFARMKATDAAPDKFATPTSWEKSKQVSSLLRYSAWKLRDNPQLQKEMQDATPISPNSYTYFLLIRHYAWTQGDLDRVFELLSEMQDRNLFMPSPIFQDIFASFVKFHGVYPPACKPANPFHRYATNPWTQLNLKATFGLYVDAADATRAAMAAWTPAQLNAWTHNHDKFKMTCEIGVRTVRHIVTAFGQRGGRDMARRVWGGVRPRWERVTAADERLVERLIAGFDERPWLKQKSRGRAGGQAGAGAGDTGLEAQRPSGPLEASPALDWADGPEEPPEPGAEDVEERDEEPFFTPDQTAEYIRREEEMQKELDALELNDDDFKI